MTEKCPNCDGKGVIECGCGGKIKAEGEVCAGCMGLGERTCPNCVGKGVVPT